MRSGRTIAFIMLALLAGGILAQLPPALGDNSENPFSGLWAAIFDLQNRDDDLQAQINELRAERNVVLADSAKPGFVSDTYTSIEVEATEDGRTLVHITAGNNGPDRAAGVKLTTFYFMPLYKINSINGDRCEDKSRGIIECTLGTLEARQESVITIDTSARETGKENAWTVDISTTTADTDYINNHMTFAFATGGAIPVQVPPGAVSEEDSDSGANSTSTETEESQSSGNQTSGEAGESVNDSNSTSSEETQQTSEGSGESSAETSNGQTEQQSDQSGTGEPSEDGNKPAARKVPGSKA